MGSNTLIEPVEFNQRELALNGVTFAAERNSDPFGTEGYNQLTIEWVITRVAATDISFYVAALMPDGSTYGRLRVGDLDPSTGIETMRLRQFVIPDMATAANQKGQVNLAINSLQMRLEAIVGTAATTDTLIMRVRLGRV